MRANRLCEVIPLLKELKSEEKEAVERFFEGAPDWLISSMCVVRMEKDHIFVRTNMPVHTVYLVVRGTFKITDYRVYGIAYDFMQFEGLYAMGGMEIIMDLDTYQATLQTVTPCLVLQIPADIYARWLQTDIRALKQEAKIMGEYLYEQGVTSRTYMFVQGADRLAVMLVNRYEKYEQKGKLEFTNTRQELSDSSGLCVKTINRAIKKFEEQGLITRNGKKFYIDEEQYTRLKEIVSKLIEPLMERGRENGRGIF